jgi:hypothetical protein
MKRLFLHEEVMLLALHDDKGTICSENYPYAIGGAILAELLLAGRLRVDEEGKKRFVGVRANQPLGDPVIDDCLAKVAQAKRRATIQTWVGRFGNLRDLKHRVAQRLCKRGILRADEDKVLWIFTRKIYPQIDPAPERELVERLRKAIFTDAKGVDPHTVVMVSLAHVAGLLRLVFDRKELKGRKDHIRKLVDGELTGKATKETIAAMQAAVMVAVLFPAMMATVVNS